MNDPTATPDANAPYRPSADERWERTRQRSIKGIAVDVALLAVVSGLWIWLKPAPFGELSAGLAVIAGTALDMCCFLGLELAAGPPPAMQTARQKRERIGPFAQAALLLTTSLLFLWSAWNVDATNALLRWGCVLAGLVALTGALVTAVRGVAHARRQRSESGV